MRAALAAFITLVLISPAIAQQSASYRLDEHTLNGGGRPAGGVAASSASYRVSLESIAEPLAHLQMMSAAYGVGGGFPSGYPPPGEVQGVRFDDDVSLAWTGHPAAGNYNLYRRTITELMNDQAGSCEESEIGGTSTTVAGTPGQKNAWAFLVSVKNALDEEGTLGFDSDGAPRPAAPLCP